MMKKGRKEGKTSTNQESISTLDEKESYLRILEGDTIK